MQIAINHIAAACVAANIKHAIICPGSRNAPITMAFARHTKIECYSVVDERSAGFIALGIAQQSHSPVVLVCTSGSAVVNFYPAIVEAFYQRIPLLIVTADRPPELIDQWDGQTLHQNNIFGKHVKASYTMPDDYSLPEIFSQTTLQAYKDSMQGIKGPVHINVPLREPLYEAKNEEFSYPEIKFQTNHQYRQTINTLALDEVFAETQKVLIFNGAGFVSDANAKVLTAFNNKAVILSDTVSNMHAAGNIEYWDFLLSKKELLEELVPDILITTGTSTVSKNLKLFFRKFKPKHHFHISPTGDIADPFQTTPYLVKGEVHIVLSKLNWEDKNDAYLKTWKHWDDKIDSLTSSFFKDTDFSEFSSVNQAINALPKQSVLQLSNSMAVRWANLLGAPKHLSGVHSNRGVSGIDGCTSTAVGAAFEVKETVTLITGDVAFFYDSNALWNKFAPANLRIVILNNGGGGIFRLIDGPQQMPELGEFLETKHQREAELLAKDMGVEYAAASNYAELAKELESFYNRSNKPKVLEVFTKAEINTQVFNTFKQLIYGLE
jgi:2-succinyl-5-enolpyruvyl-6-hydroxy-3-cyclohexene-1-carboxylate synthase